MKKLFPLAVFVVVPLAVPVFGPILGGLLLVAVFIGLLFKSRREKWIRCATKILHTLELRSEGAAIVYPGVTPLVQERMVPLEKQWPLAIKLENDGLISLDKLPPRHMPPDVTGMVMTITPEGRSWLAKRQSSRDLPVAKLN